MTCVILFSISKNAINNHNVDIAISIVQLVHLGVDILNNKC